MTDDHLKMKEPIALFSTMDGIVVMSRMSDGSYRIYNSGDLVSIHWDRAEAEQAVSDYCDQLEDEARKLGLLT